MLERAPEVWRLAGNSVCSHCIREFESQWVTQTAELIVSSENTSTHPTVTDSGGGAGIFCQVHILLHPH